MKETTHTPGPWEVKHAAGTPTVTHLETWPGGSIVARPIGKMYRCQAAEANARLIAAAPELRAALERIEEIATAHEDRDDVAAIGLQEHLREIIRETREALATVRA